MSFIKKLTALIGKRRAVLKVAWLGLDYAGKTTIIKKVSQGVFDENTKRTLGLNVDEFVMENIKFVCWDIGGQSVFRESLWDAYVAGSSGIIYVVDSSDSKRFEEARQELWKYVIENPRVGGVPMLILANKQDLPAARSAGEVARSLDLHKVTKQSYAIVPVSAASGFNLEDALEWLRQRITEQL